MDRKENSRRTIPLSPNNSPRRERFPSFGDTEGSVDKYPGDEVAEQPDEDEVYLFVPTIITRYFFPIVKKVFKDNSTDFLTDSKPNPVSTAFGTGDISDPSVVEYNSLMNALRPTMGAVSFGTKMLRVLREKSKRKLSQ